jgi:hypothetical protein
MLAEIFMLRMEANLRNERALDTRFVPIDLTDPKPSQQIDSGSRVIDHPVGMHRASTRRSRLD